MREQRGDGYKRPALKMLDARAIRKGVGYAGAATDWDIQEYLNAKDALSSQILSIINTLIRCVRSTDKKQYAK